LKIAITGHTAGIGKALSTVYHSLGHEIVGLSKREGHNIRNIPKICDMIEPCDVFVNNAQAGYAQTELLFEMANRWKSTGKHIVVISTMMTLYPTSVLSGLDMDQYWLQKTTLEQAVSQIRHLNYNIRLTVVRPGNIATSSDKTVPPAADPINWAKTLLNIFETASKNNLVVPDISLGPI
jgi:nucleoside-diphosphate-sugar epimerase